MFGNYIKDLRQKQGLSCKGFANLLGRATSTIHGIETGVNKNPGFDIICEISDKLGVSTEELKRAFKKCNNIKTRSKQYVQQSNLNGQNMP